MQKSICKLTTAALFCLMLIGLSLAQENATQEKVTITSIVGKVEVKSSGTGNWREARIGMPLKISWDVRTYVESSAEITFESGSVIKLAENSVVNLSSLYRDKASGTQNSKIKVASGQIFANVSKLVNKKSDFSFETPTAVAAIRGTRLGLSVDKDKTILDVYEGKVVLRNRGSSKEILVSTRNRGVVKTGESEVATFKFEDLLKDTTLKTLLQDVVLGKDTTRDTSVHQIQDTTKTTGAKDSSLVKTDSAGIVKDTTAAPKDTTKQKSDSLNTKGGTDKGKQDSLGTKKDTVGTKKETDKTKTDTLGLKKDKKPDTTIAPIKKEIIKDPPVDTVKKNNDKIIKTEESKIIPEKKTEVTVTIESPDNNSIILESKVTVRGVATPGAKVSVGSKVASVKTDGSFSVSYDLSPGPNRIVVMAQLGTVTASAGVMVEYRPAKSLFLTIAQPTQSMKVDNPIITVKGMTLPQAEILVDETAVTVAGDGSFSYQVHIPDEPGEYTITIISRYNGKDMREERTIQYKPKREKIFLMVNKPADGSLVRSSVIQVAGQSIARAGIEINGRRIKALDNGMFAMELQVNEKDIGDYPIEISATDEETNEDLTKNISVKIDINSPQINTSVPRVAVVGQLQGGTKVSNLVFQVSDMTPQDVLSVKVLNANISTQFTMDPNEQEKIALEDGKNNYTVRATDLAGNVSNTVAGELYYLPGPLVLELLEPDNSMFSIEDLPPMPGNVGLFYIDLKVKVDDGIGTVPETILYCRVNGANLKKGSNYQYTSRLEVKRGVNSFVLEAEDVAGNKARKQFAITIND